MISRRLFSATAALAVAASVALLLSGRLTSHAVQNPTVSLDMVTTGTTYDDTTNTMTVGTIDNSSTGSQDVSHIHATHLVINNVEDLVGWQARLNYVGDRLRPSSQNTVPFTDNNTLQNVGFTNLPIDQTTLVHRDVTDAAGIPVAPPDNTNTPQTALIGGTYNGTPTFPVSPDTPAKAVPDDSSYSAPSGGVISQLNLQVLGNECNTGTMTMDLDDGSPNPPGSSVVIFNGAGTTTTNLAESALFDGTHSETGGTCGSSTPTATATATSTPCPSCTPTPTATPTPRGATEPCCTPTMTASATPTPCGVCTPTPTFSPADAAITRLRTPHNVQLRPGEPDTGTVSIATSGDFGYNVYLALLPPGGAANPGGCSSGASLVGISTFGGSFTFKPNIGWSCADPAAVNGLNWEVKAFADVHFDDQSSCDTLVEAFDGTCAAAIADDDSNDANNTLTRSFPKVVAQ